MKLRLYCRGPISRKKEKFTGDSYESFDLRKFARADLYNNDARSISGFG
jgi:hypothetical protein